MRREIEPTREIPIQPVGPLPCRRLQPMEPVRVPRREIEPITEPFEPLTEPEKFPEEPVPV